MEKWAAAMAVKIRSEAAEVTAWTVVDVPVTGDRKQAANEAADRKFRDLGLGTVMDMPGATVAIDTWRY